MKKCNVFLLVLICLTGIHFYAFTQKTEIFDDPEAKYRIASDLFEKQKYGAARKIFEELAESISAEESALKTDAEYYAAICALELYHGDAEYLITRFINTHPEYSKSKSAYYKLGNFQYNNKKYHKALDSYELVDVYELNNEEYYEYYFRKSYSYFLIDRFDAARQGFYVIKDRSNLYASAAKYYYGHIEYMDGNYETALKEFEKLVNDENFGAIVPYYIIQIYYLQERYEELLKTGPPLMETVIPKRLPEVARLIGQAYCRTGKFTLAIPYLEKYRENTTGSVSQADNYELGFAYYKAGQNEKAIEFFKKVTATSDSLSQNAYYHIADCYVKTGQKNYARNAFASAFKMPFDETIKEDALFNYAKLSYELSFNPYNEAILAFQQYIAQYPNLKKTDEARRYLINMYLSTNNYKDALTSIEAITLRDKQLNTAYQRICYFRGVELFNTGGFQEAIHLFSKSAGMFYDSKIIALSLYWKAEAFYRLNEPDSALVSYRKFLFTADANELPEYNMVNYNLGYVYFNKQDFNNALVYFRKFTGNTGKEALKIVNDAYLRMGDCYFKTKDYTTAITNYDEAIRINAISADYAYYQKGLSLGVLGQFTPKVDIMKKLIETYRESPHAIDAKWELANTYQFINNNTSAMKYFNDIITNHPKSIYVKKCMLKIGLIHYDSKDDAKALEIFSKVVRQYPGTPEAMEAYKQVRNIYVDMNKIDDFLIWSEQVAFASVGNAEQDSITYSAVENRYMEGDCASAVKGFENYITKFPNGFFILPANFYKAECEFRDKNFNKALVNYEFVLEQSKNDFTEKSLLKASWIHYQNKNYEKALQYYTRLEENADYKNNLLTARSGMMRCNYYMKNYEQAIISSQKLLNTPKATNEQINEAHYIIAKSALELKNIPLAQSEFEITSKLTNSDIAAESKYNLAYLQYSDGNYEKSEKMIYDFIKQEPSEDYWLAKSFLLLSDIYINRGDNFQAKQTLQGIIDNYKGADLLNIAREKLNALKEKEKIETKKKQPDEIEIHLNQTENSNTYEFEQEQ